MATRLVASYSTPTAISSARRPAAATMARCGRSRRRAADSGQWLVIREQTELSSLSSPLVTSHSLHRPARMVGNGRVFVFGKPPQYGDEAFIAAIAHRDDDIAQQPAALGALD